MIISLDWDKISSKEAKRRCKKIIKLFWVKSIDLYYSPMGKGFHCYLYVNEEELLDFTSYVIRYHLADDEQRLEQDKKFRNYKASVLFNVKMIDGVEYKEKFVESFLK